MSSVRRVLWLINYNELRCYQDIDDVKRQLQKAKHKNNELETKLRTNATIKQQAHLLEGKVKENAETINQLWQEQSLLAKDHKELQRQFTEVSERVNKLHNDYARSQSSHDNHHHQLDLHLSEIDDLRHVLSNQANELQHSEEEKNCMAIEKTDVACTVAALESNLRRVKQDAEIRLLNEQLNGQHTKLKTAQEKFKIKDYGFATWVMTVVLLCCILMLNKKISDGYQLVELKKQHKEECKGLVIQIQYLKAKFTHESTLRDELIYQKHYLLVLLSNFEASEKRILACISWIGYLKPKNPPAIMKKTCSIKSIVLSVVFIQRVRQVSEAWREAICIGNSLPFNDLFVQSENLTIIACTSSGQTGGNR
ncbi:hypothetical protein BDR06DRAFT_1061558 [Suillus hirtellus]|nr:hypothetical protein BDR06DRAFT_1061558 [Suillus hirtellus]